MSQLAPTRSRKRKHSETQPPPTNTTNPSSKIEESHDGPHEPATTKGARSNPKDVEAAYPAEPNDRESELPEAQGQKPKSQRFIVFIGAFCLLMYTFFYSICYVRLGLNSCFFPQEICHTPPRTTPSNAISPKCNPPQSAIEPSETRARQKDLRFWSSTGSTA